MADAIQAGDYFLLPYKGKRRDLLVQTVEPHEGTGHWYVRKAVTGERLPSSVLPSSCIRCSHAFAARIVGVPVPASAPAEPWPFPPDSVGGLAQKRNAPGVETSDGRKA